MPAMEAAPFANRLMHLCNWSEALLGWFGSNWGISCNSYLCLAPCRQEKGDPCCSFTFKSNSADSQHSTRQGEPLSATALRS